MDEASANSPLPRRVLNAEEAAKYLGGAPVIADTLKNLARRKKIGHLKVGRTTVFPVEALDQYIADHTVAVVENPWGLTDLALQHIREGRSGRRPRPFLT